MRGGKSHALTRQGGPGRHSDERAVAAS